MGYRCDVIIRCEEKAYKLFQQAIAEGGYKPKEIYTTGEHYIICWNWVKWEDDIPAVSQVMKVVDSLLLKENASGYRFSFFRNGEAQDDKELISNCDGLELWLQGCEPIAE
ncbi:MAG: hypothetical protein KH357_08115 [Clostridiales bacterium]|nr:hypothetical protein [Clostridiales bacterium]